jgi:putative membrane-bound dehydrogenase-like protein
MTMRIVTTATATAIFALLGTAAVLQSRAIQTRQTAAVPARGLTLRHDVAAGTISVLRPGRSAPLVTQQAGPDTRPYLHPIAAPDGRGVLTEASPAHHAHQTGLYFGFTRMNGRDYFHNRGADYWRRVSVTVLQASGAEVRWQTVYDLLDEAGAAVLRETQRWSMREQDGRFLLDLTWRGEARRDITIAKYDYGGLFLRMPWREGIRGEVVNAARQRNDRAEGQRAMWIDVGMQVAGRDDLAHIAIFDHPDNTGYPQAWRVDSQLGVGTARARAADWTIAANQTEVIRHRLVVYTGVLDDVAMTAAWTDYSGNRSTYSTSALWNIAQQEGRAATFLSPQDAVARMTMVNGYKVNAWAAEPMVTQPMAFCWDDRGRLWVAENRDYESRVQGFSNAGDSRIIILEDTDRDGVADSRKVFLEGIPFPAAIAVGFDGLFLGAPPNLLFVPDRDGDDKADMADIEVRLTGWGISDRHETINSLHWGPDGWLYGLQGYATSSKIRKPAGKGRLYAHKEPFPDDLLKGPGVDINGGVWRYHPTKDRFEVVAHGFSNPWGIDYDAKGQLLISACVIPHLWHVIPGGVYHRQGGQHFNPYVYSDIQTIADHRHRSAHGGARVYQSDAFPSSQAGRIFMANIHEHAVLSDVLARKGSGFTATHGDDFLLANNAQWIGFSLEIGPDGGLYVLDWHDGDICGQAILHKETGRIFRISPEKSGAVAFEGRYGDLKKMTDAQLVDLQTSPSDWHARRARIILQGRAAAGTLSAATRQQLRQMFITSRNPDWRLRAMWTLHVTGAWNADTLIQILDDADEYVRAWAVQLLTEDGSPSPAVLDSFLRMAQQDASAVVRLYLASALQRISEEQRWPIASALMAHGEDAADHNQPKILWLGIEPLVPRNPAMALEHAGRSRIPQLAQFIARRAVDADGVEAVVAAIAKAPPASLSLLEGMRDGLQGRAEAVPPANWAAVYSRLRRSDALRARVAADIAQQFGDTELVRRHLATLRNERARLEDRQRALQVLAGQRRPQLASELPAMLSTSPLRLEAIRAVAAFDSDRLGRLLIEQYSNFSSAEKAEALQTLSSRPRYGRMVMEAIGKGTIPRRDIPAHMPRQLLRVVGTSFLEVWGPVERSAADERAYARYRGVLNETALSRANVASGRTLFQKTCGSCHRLNGEGGSLGPDLTGTNRVNLNWLLTNVLEPNADVQDAYRMTVVTTRDGRTHNGTIAAETDRQLTLRVIGGEQTIVNKADIQSRETTAVSMMPPGLLDSLTDGEVVDLIAYIRRVETAAGRK